MSLSSDERAVSELIGFMFIFGFIVILMSLWQAQVVPAENKRIEFKHYQQAQEDLSELRSAHIDAAESGTTRSATVKLGTTYPSRAIFVNAPPPRGRIQTDRLGNGTITANNLDVSRVCGQSSSVTTNSITYEPEYNHFSDSELPSYRYENTILYRDAGNGSVIFESDQTLIQGSTINLYPVADSITQSGVLAATIDFAGAETGTTTVDGSITLSIPTKLTAEQWAETLPNDSVNSTRQINSNRVEIELIDQSWEVGCSAVGTEGTPDVDPPDADDLGVGTGDVSEYSTTDNIATLAVSGGRWSSITCTDQTVLSNGKPATKPNGNNLQGDVIRLTFDLNNSMGNQFVGDVQMARDSDGSWNTKQTVIYDSNGNSVSATLKPTAAERIYGDGETDILELSNYDSPGTGSDSFTDYVNRIQRLDDNPPVNWQTVRMIGRVDVELDCDAPPSPPASGVVTLDGSTPDSGRTALLFDLQVAADSSRTITAVNITTPGNQNSAVNDADKLKRSGSSTEISLEPSNTNGGNQSGGLATGTVKLDGTKYSLDTNAIFSDGAVLSADLGDLNGGSVDFTYSIADSESDADVIVTFYFQDGGRHRVFLRVTNVNS